MKAKIYKSLPIEAKRIREEVFIKEQGFIREYDEIDDIATHIVVFDGNEPIATCRVFESRDHESYTLGRLAVKKEYRGKGVGSGVVAEAERYVAGLGIKNMILHSQLTAKDFYQRLGFSEYGEVEYEEDCPHIWMKKELS